MSAKRIDLIGQRFGRLVALEPISKRDFRCIVWKCKCDCGNLTFVRSSYLLKKSTKSCGCLRREILSNSGRLKRKDITMKRFGRLVALKPTRKRLGSSVIWLCKCDCGNIIFAAERNMQQNSLKSCGCLNDATRFSQHTHINPMDVPFEITNVMKARRELKKAIKQAS